MTLPTILTAVAGYVVLAVLLLSLNVTSLWRWWIKAGAIVITTAFFILTYLGLNNILGWPSSAAVPPRFKLLWTQVVEPDQVTGASGAIYLWLETLDQNNVSSGVPRNYQVPYSEQLAEDVRAAQERRENGEEIMGELTPREPDPNATNEQRRMGNPNVQPLDQQSTETTPYFNDSQVMTFQDLPPIITPDKV